MRCRNATIRSDLKEPAPEKTHRVASVRFLHNPYFIGREKVLLDIHERLHPAPTPGLTQGSVHAISGVGGVGKTTLAREYAEKFWRLYHDILWVSADTNLLEVEFAHLALQLHVATSGNVHDDALAALHELNSRAPRLLVFDNAANQQSIERWLPTSDKALSVKSRPTISLACSNDPLSSC